MFRGETALRRPAPSFSAVLEVMDRLRGVATVAGVSEPTATEPTVSGPTVAEVVVAPEVALSVHRWAGEGVAFLLVHGLASNLHLWDGVAAALAAAGHPVAAVDLRGHGRSAKPDHGYDFATLTDDLVAVLDALGFSRPVVVGQSMGANLALELAWRFPALVGGVACIDGGWIELGRRFPSWEDCAAALVPPVTAGRPAAEIEGMLRRHHPNWPEAAIQGVLACFEHRADATVAPWLTLERHLALLRAMWEHRPSTRYPDIEVPVLLVPAGRTSPAGERPERVEAAAAALPRGEVHWMAGDHDLHAQHPEAVAALLLSHFLVAPAPAPAHAPAPAPFFVALPTPGAPNATKNREG